MTDDDTPSEARRAEAFTAFAQRTREAYATRAARIRDELVNLVSDAMITGDPGSVAVGADIDTLAEIAVDAVAEWFSQGHSFITEPVDGAALRRVVDE